MAISQYSKKDCKDLLMYCGCESARFVCCIAFAFGKDGNTTRINVCQNHKQIWAKKAAQLGIKTKIMEVKQP